MLCNTGVLSCVEDGRHVEEDAFEVSGAGTTPRSYAPQKGRLNREQQVTGHAVTLC